ncbi:MAG: hypothetical protein IJ661_04275 [Lachnospiraceae bacterium]|nr:hypothetical protein [Lachnospiraceae bacterium]
MKGEERRRWLQRIRRRIAENNDIVYMQAEQHEEGCAGDCRMCQAEARYIDAELRRKAKLGEDVRLSSILCELLMDVDLTIGVCSTDGGSATPKPNIFYIQSVTSSENKASSDTSVKSIDDMNLTIHLDSTLKRYGISNTNELYDVLRSDASNMKKKLRGGYRYLVERLEELGYNITEEMR